MQYTEYLIDQKERNDFVGLYADKVISESTLPNFKTMKEHLMYQLDLTPNDINSSVGVILSWLEFCECLFAEMETTKTLSSGSIREIRNTANSCLEYLNLYWKDYFFADYDKATNTSIYNKHESIRKWIMELEEFESELRYRECKDTICKY